MVNTKSPAAPNGATNHHSGTTVTKGIQKVFSLIYLDCTSNLKFVSIVELYVEIWVGQINDNYAPSIYLTVVSTPRHISSHSLWEYIILHNSQFYNKYSKITFYRVRHKFCPIQNQLFFDNASIVEKSIIFRQCLIIQ